jgi:CRP-like cAMP-binding protein
LVKSADPVFLRTVPLFRDLFEPDLAALALSFRDRRVKKGEVLFREGDAGRELYLIREGSVIVSKLVTGRVEQVLARIAVGEIFGEMSLFDDAPRSATIQAETDSVLLCLDREGLRGLTENRPHAAAAVLFRLVQLFVARLRASGNLVAEVTRWGLEATGMDLETRTPS